MLNMSHALFHFIHIQKSFFFYIGCHYLYLIDEETEAEEKNFSNFSDTDQEVSEPGTACLMPKSLPSNVTDEGCTPCSIFVCSCLYSQS